MTDLQHAAHRKIALKVLAQHAGPVAGTDALAAAARRAYEDLARVSVPLIGQAGVEALTGRALHLAQRDYPWLAQPEAAGQAGGPFARAVFNLQRQDPAVAVEAAGTVIAILTGLLVTFIGESLTTGLLHKAWPGAFSDAGTEEPSS